MARKLFVSNTTQTLHGQTFNRNDIHPQIDGDGIVRGGMHGDWDMMDLPSELEQYIRPDWLPGVVGVKINETGTPGEQDYVREVVKDDTTLDDNVGELRNWKRREIIMACEAKLQVVLSLYPASEVSGFSLKRELAYKWEDMDDTEKDTVITDDAAETKKRYKILIAEADAHSGADAAEKRGKVNDLMTSIKSKAELYEEYYGKCIKVKSDAEDEIDAATGDYDTVKTALDAIDPSWPTYGA